MAGHQAGGRLVLPSECHQPWAEERSQREEGSIWDDQHFYSPEER